MVEVLSHIPESKTKEMAPKAFSGSVNPTINKRMSAFMAIFATSTMMAREIRRILGSLHMPTYRALLQAFSSYLPLYIGAEELQFLEANNI